jgi:hypothetical protein
MWIVGTVKGITMVENAMLIVGRSFPTPVCTSFLDGRRPAHLPDEGTIAVRPRLRGKLECGIGEKFVVSQCRRSGFSGAITSASHSLACR